MKHGKKPTREQRKLIEKWGLDARVWLVTKNMNDKLVLQHRHTGLEKTIERRKAWNGNSL